jgi:tetratricopeptide (TPR) repeat protein
MRRPFFSLFLALAAVSRANGASVDEFMKLSASAYRQGRLLDALQEAARALEIDPTNAVVKNAVWKMAQEAKRRQGDARLKPGEMEKALRLAEKDLETRRKETEATLAQLKEAARKTTDAKSPMGLLAALGDLDKSGISFDTSGGSTQGALYLGNIVQNLTGAIQKGVFVSRKDHLRAQGYLAYYQNDWKEALEKWEAALKEDPRDKQLLSDVSSLKELTRRRQAERELKDLVRQAETYQQTGLYAEAVDAWQQVLKMDAKTSGAMEGLSVSRVALEKSRLQKTLEVMMEKGVALYKEGQYLKAAEVWLEALQLDPTYQKARAWLKLASGKLDQEATPSPPAAKGPALQPLLPRPPAQALGTPARALTEADARKAEDLYKQGLLLYANENLAGAVDIWKKSLKLNPDLTKAQEALRHAQAELSFR